MVRKIHIYIVGVVLLGLVQEWLKNAMPNWTLLFVLIVAYLALLRFVAEKFGKP